MTGQSVLITGASGFLGGAMSRALAEAGATVVVGSRDALKAQRVAEALPGDGPHYGVELNHLDEESLNKGFDAAVKAAGTIDVLVNNGQQGHAMDLTDVTAEAFSQDLQNATGYFLLARKLRDHVVSRQTPGSIVMMSSIAHAMTSVSLGVAADAGADVVELQRAEAVGDQAGGARFLEAEFGMLMNVAARGDQLRKDLGRDGVDPHAHRGGHTGRLRLRSRCSDQDNKTQDLHRLAHHNPRLKERSPWRAMESHGENQDQELSSY